MYGPSAPRLPHKRQAGHAAHEGQVVSSGISLRLARSPRDRCKQLHLHVGLHYKLKGKAVLNLRNAQQKRGQGPFVRCFIPLMSYKKRAKATLVNRKWSLTILGGVYLFISSRIGNCVTSFHYITTQANVF